MSECTGGEATCTTLAVCTVCGNAYGELKEHNYGEWLASVDNENRVRSCVNCDATETANLKTVYLNPQSKSNGTWISDDAWFAAYFFGNGEVWVKMTDENNDGIYECAIPSGFTSIILCRMDPTKTTLSWDSKWNQSLDLVLEAKKDSYTYTFKDWSAAEGKCNFDVVATHSECVYNIANATCENAKKCVICDYIAQSALGHAWDNGVITTDPTCEDKGVKTYTCGTCGDTYTETIDKLGHDMSDFVVTSAPSCTKEGEERSDCSRCDYFETNVLDIVDHTHTTYTSNNDATCTQDGTKTSVCDVCGGDAITVTDTGSSLDHTVEIDEAVAATCTATGKTEGKHCSVCNTVLVAQEIVAAKGHTEVIDDAVAPSCDKTGLTEGKHCSVCEAVLVAQSEVPMVAHTYDDIYDAICNVCGHEREDAACAHTETEVVEGYAATCTTPGLTDGAKCVKCGEIVTAQTTIDALGHTEVIDEAVTATCTTAGKTEGKHCSVCNTVLVAQTVVPALGHNKVAHEAKAATCTAIGWNAYETCSRCDYTTYEEIEVLGHDIVTDKAVDATCTATGLTEGSHCSRCDHKVAQTVVPALGHSYNATVTAPTCTDKGYTTHTCSSCNASYKDTEKDELGHSYDAWYAVSGNIGKEQRDCVRCEENETRSLIFFKPNSNWTQSNARFCVYAWNSSGNIWIEMASVGKGYYACIIPEGYSEFKFVRMNPSTTSNNWNSGVKWNEDSNTSLPTNGNNLYTMKSGWDNCGGTWSTHTQAYSIIYFKPSSNYTSTGYKFAAYTWINDSTNTWLDLQDTDGDGIYECRVPSGYGNIIFSCMKAKACGNDWSNVKYQSADLKVPTNGNNLLTLNTGTNKPSGTWSKK